MQVSRELSNGMLFTSNYSEELFIDENNEKKVFNNQQPVTPFSIANYTSRTIKIVRGGIKSEDF
jgi:hypothetical protein